MNLTDFSGQRPGGVQEIVRGRRTRRTLCRLKLLRLAGATNASVEPPEWDDLLVVGDVAEVGIRLAKFETCPITAHWSTCEWDALS